jgi:RNA ligase (TIGR02306 family)
MRGNFPSWLRKTDQERVQNLDGQIDYAQTYEATIKLDGSSMTIWFKDGEWGVCSRNIDLKTDQEGNTFVDTAKQVIGHEVLPGIAWPDNIAIQGELMGPGIQGNRENLKEHEFFVFDIWDIEKQEYYKPEDVCSFCYLYGLEHVPVISAGKSLESLGITSVESALAYAEGKSLRHVIREGVVFKREDGCGSFKAIANSFLLGEK